MRYLTVITFFPLIIAATSLVVARIRGTTGYLTARMLLTVLLCLIIFIAVGYQPKLDDPQSLWMVEPPFAIFAQWNLNYAPALDGISLLPALSVIVLTTMAFFARAAGPISSMTLLLASLACSLGALFASDLMLFIIFMESSLSLNLLSVALKKRSLLPVVRKAFITQSLTMAPILLAVLAIHWKGGGAGFMPAGIVEATLDFSPAMQLLLALSFCLTLGFRIPLVPIHGWFMEISDESDPASATTLFAMVSLVAAYGFIRFTLPLFPAVPPLFWSAIGAAAALGLLHMGLVAYGRSRPAQIITRVRVAAANLVIVGMISATRPAVAGAVFILVTQSLAFAVLCLMLDSLDRRGNPSPEIIAAKMPRMATLAFIATLGIIGLPGTAGFVGQILTLGGAFRSHPIVAALAALGMGTLSVSLLSLLRRAFRRGMEKSDESIERLYFRELLPPIAILTIIIGLGIFPGVILHRITPSVDRLCEELRHRRVMAAAIEKPMRAVEDPFDAGAVKKPPLLGDK